MKEKIATTIGILTIIGIVFGGYFWIENRYALSEELRKIEQRLDYKIISDQIQSIQDRIWKIIDRSGSRPKDAIIKEELRQLEEIKANLKMKLENLEKK